MDRPANVLIISTWYPSVEDQIAGRFVADQADALRASGRVEPTVISFDPAAIFGSPRWRDATAAATTELAATSVRSRDDVFSVRGFGVATPIRTARLVLPAGRYPSDGPAYAAAARARALDALADRWLDAKAAGAVGSFTAMPDVIHAHTAYPDGAGSVGLARRLGRPLVITEHSSVVERHLATPDVRSRYREAIAAAARFVVVSQTLASEIAGLVPEVASKLVVIPNVVDVERFAMGGPLSERNQELIFVGYRKPSKGIDVLLRAFASVHARRSDVRLRLVGSSPSAEVERQWHTLAGDLGITGLVRFDPPTDRSGVAEALSRARVFVHPSPRETFGVVAAEALAAGIPVVGADSGGVTEIVGPETDGLGLIVPPGDPDALARSIERMLDRLDSLDRGRLRASATARFGAAGVAGRLADLYDAVRGETAAEGHVPNRPTDDGRSRLEPTPDAATPPIRIVLALDPDRARRLAALPEAVRARMLVVTSGPGPAGTAASIDAGLGRLVSTIADSAAIGPAVHGWRRLARAVRHPVAVARRRGLIPGPEQRIVREAGAALDRAVERATSIAPGAPIELVCLDGVDHIAAAPLLRRSALRLTPGGIRWLGDQALTGVAAGAVAESTRPASG